MATPTQDQIKRVKDNLDRAEKRFDGAAKAAARHSADEGEFDNNFDGIVTGIFHVVDAVELARTGVRRRVGEGEQSTIIRSVVLTIQAVGIPVPPASRLVDLNTRRNASVHGDWMEVLDHESLEEAAEAGRALLVAAREYIGKLGH